MSEGVKLAGHTSAFVIIGNYRTGPFQDRTWKARHGVALIEKLTPIWTSSPLGYSIGEQNDSAAISLPSGSSLADELIFIIAATAMRSEPFQLALEAEGLGARQDDGQVKLAIANSRIDSGPGLSPRIIDAALESLLGVVRLGIVRLSETSLLDETATVWLRGKGLDVDDFALV